MTAHSGDGSWLQYELNKEEWEAMTSDKTDPKRRQHYFNEFRGRIRWFWQKRDGMEHTRDLPELSEDDDDYRVNGGIE
jgi:hypothetical protein